MASVIHLLMPDRLARYDYSFVFEILSTDFSMAPHVLQPRWQAVYHSLTGGVWAGTLIALLLTSVVFVVVRLNTLHTV